METDISRKVIPIVKYFLPAALILALLVNGAVWLYWRYNSYTILYDAKVAGSFVHVKTMTNGKLTKILVKNGQSVKAGEEIAEVNPQVTKKDLEQLQKAVEQAQSQYDQLKALNQPAASPEVHTVQRATAPSPQAQAAYQAALARQQKMEELYKEGAVSRKEYDQSVAAASSARAALNTTTEEVVRVPAAAPSVSSGVTANDLSIAAARVKQAQTALEEAQKNDGVTKIYAPVAGTIYFNNIKNGLSLKAGDDLFEIATSSDLWIDAKITSAAAGKIKQGAYAACTFDGRTVGGTVAQIAPVEKSNLMQLKITLPSADLAGLKPNMLGTVKIATKS